MHFARNGIYTTTLWIAGFPGEREKDWQETMRFLKENSEYIYQADIWEYICFPREQSSSEEIEKHFMTKPVYPEEYDDLLIIKYYDLKSELAAPERFEKIRDFETLRVRLGVPNPYSLRELMAAQTRWRKLGHQKGKRRAF